MCTRTCAGLQLHWCVYLCTCTNVNEYCMSVCVYICVLLIICVVCNVHVLTAAALCIFSPIWCGEDVFAAFLYSVLCHTSNQLTAN